MFKKFYLNFKQNAKSYGLPIVMPETKKIAVIGAGISGMAAAIQLAAKGMQVSVYEKNASFGGRGQAFQKEGFFFDMGPSWYWMPDVFEDFFNEFGKSCADYFQLVRLDPSYQILFKNETVVVPAQVGETYALFESIEPGSSIFLRKFLDQARIKYETGMKDFVRKPSLHWHEFFELRLLKAAFQIELFKSFEKSIFKNIKDDRLRQLLCFPVLFLGAKPSDTPALYSLMNYADLVLGTWYPMGGMHKLFEALYQLALEKGVQFHFNTAIEKINIEGGRTVGFQIQNQSISCDAILSAADYHHTESALIDPAYRQYTDAYWETRKMSPSALIFYLGVSKKLDQLLHHNLFFKSDFNQHAANIYDHPAWPEDPLFYVCVPSKTDDSVAPRGMENLFILIPLAAGLQDSKTEQDALFSFAIDQLEKHTGQSIRDHIVVNERMSVSDFYNAYNSFKGNAYGLSNTLLQTAVLKPRIRSKKVKGLYYAGQLSHPGPGLPPCLISGQISALQLLKDLKL